MAREPTSKGDLPRDFPSTHWSSLLALTDPRHTTFHKHLSILVERYWRPAYFYLRALRHLSRDDAADFAQGFFTRLVEKGKFEHLSPERGSFRRYLKTALRNFSVNALEHERVRQPGGGARLFRFEQADEEWERLIAGTPAVTPEEAFDREWARGLIQETIKDLEHVLSQQGKSLYFEMFRELCLAPCGMNARKGSRTPLTGESGGDASYDEVAARHGIARHDVDHYLRHAKRVYVRLLKEKIVEYLGPGEDAERELMFLLSL